MGPPSHVHRPGKLWPPLRTAEGGARSRANRTAAMTSATPVQRAMSAGRRSIEPFQSPGQEDVVRAAVEGRDTLALMPTGSGKSLTYQLAAMLRPTPTLVLSR